MDVVKLLSRGIKRVRNSTTKTGTTLPSAGPIDNPQLFHDEELEPRGQKRKRYYFSSGEQDISPTDEELNYFARKAENKQSSNKETAMQDSQRNGQKTRKEDLYTRSKSPELVDPIECRRILRSHRLKVTLLPSGGIRNPSLKEPKKLSNKRKSGEIPKRKVDEEPRQIYPQPLLDFKDLETTYGISRRLGENLFLQGYKIPTEVQIGSLPLLVRPEIALSSTENGDEVIRSDEIVNLLTVAPTGSGKTLAFLIPVINSMVQRRREAQFRKSHRLEAIIVAPTKELASQIVNEGRKLALRTGIRVVGMQKGMKVIATGGDCVNDKISLDEGGEDEEDSELEQSNGTSAPFTQTAAKADILVTTPLVLLHALSLASGAKQTLPTVQHLVLDEADVLLDSLFREQTQGIWDACTDQNLRVMLWSATMGSNIEALAVETIHNRSRRLSIDRPSRIIRLVVGLKDSAIPNISHRLLYTANEPGKLLALRQLLSPTSSSTQPLRPPFLIFTQTIPRAIALHSELLYDIPLEAGGSSRLAILHSDLSDTARSHVMSRFRSGEIWILITTDILSRGVDFRGVNGVVNYDIPTSSASYVHRVGRTGRAGRDGGVAVTFYTKEDIPYTKNIANVIAASEKAAGKTEGEGLQKWLLDALPKTSKQAKKTLKMHGVEVRRAGLAKKQGRKGQISTKSGFERRLENRKKGAIAGSKRRANASMNSQKGDVDNAEASEWSGIDG